MVLDNEHVSCLDHGDGKKPYVRRKDVAMLNIKFLRTQVRHQASDIAKLRQEFLSLLYCSVISVARLAEQKSNEALGNTHTRVLPLPQ